MKKKLQTLLDAKNQRKAEIVKSIEGSESVEEIKRFSADLETLNGEIRDLEGMLADLPDETEARTAAVTAPEIVKTQAEEERKAGALWPAQADSPRKGLFVLHTADRDYAPECLGRRGDAL